MRSRILASVMSLFMALSLCACAGKSVPEFKAQYYPECYDPIDKLCKDQSNQAEVKGAVAGGIIGALGGAVAGVLATGKAEGALVGAGIGAAAGAMTGFFAARLNKIKEQDKRLAEYQNILGEQSKGWDIERASVEKAYKCYGEQMTMLANAMRAKKITREEFLARMKEISAGIKHINTYWADAQNRMDETLADGDKWLAAEDAEAAKAQQPKNVVAVKTQKTNLGKIRATNAKGNEKVNLVKTQTLDQEKSLMAEFDVRGFEDNLASLNVLLASL